MTHLWSLDVNFAKHPIRHSENRNVTLIKLSCNEVQAAVPLIIYRTAALTSLSDGISYITFSFSEWRVKLNFKVSGQGLDMQFWSKRSKLPNLLSFVPFCTEELVNRVFI